MHNKKIIILGIFAFAFVFSVGSSPRNVFAAMDPGCTATTKYSATTGRLCSSNTPAADNVSTLAAQTSSDGGQKLIDAMKGVIANLQASGQSVPAILKLAARQYVGLFTKSLTLGSNDDQVKLLQQFLNFRGFPVAATGVGSIGNETTYFGPATRAALAKFQASIGISPASGFFGPATRARIELLSQ